ncbi:TIGR03086 family metal-binding protein [Mycolicibacterium moriokaense]|uniref:Uncharacterized protein (TIGR03086 family) n=1 Tax=Mycolicibacterium moriokaense TaxID=39691 RepID=A0A318H489_9MYCO|nr:TIGR03086 family metal-binding protein [Mycolicibacterium moriokaense]PXW98506.1 uncharacterized protein (TIGR03086 family) [Mycolicibacterium moriokaense]
MRDHHDTYALDAAALHHLRADVANLSDAELGLPTRCDGWTVEDLIQHMNAEHDAILNRFSDPLVLARDVRAAFDTTAGRWIEAFAGDNSSPATVFVPKLAMEVPTQSVLSVHFMDMLVHWLDLADARGQSIHIPDEWISVALGVAQAISADSSLRDPTSPAYSYAAPVPVPADASALDALVAALGRSSASGPTMSYVLGHADAEIQRLLLQAHLYEQPTEQALRAAGLEPGMRVLDIGCGPGDVSLIAARLVGPTGRVIGIDASPDIVALARQRAAENGVTTVSFEHSTVDDITPDEPVDAVIGRLILMHLPEPVAALRRLATLVRPGGVIAFCDFDMTAARSVPWLPTWQTAAEAIASAFRGAGLDPQFGTTLHRLFRHAGLDTPQLTISAPVGTAKNTEHAAYVANSWRLMQPVAERLGVVDGRLADLEALESNLCNEIATADGIAVLPALITAWTQR